MDQPDFLSLRAKKQVILAVMPTRFEKATMTEPFQNLDRTGDKRAAEVSLPPRKVLTYEFEILDNRPADQLICHIIDLHSAVHGPTTVDHLLEFVEHQRNLAVFCASKEQQPVGYMIGHEFKPSKYLSWMVGVHPDHRREGIAAELLYRLSDWAESKGYSCLRTESSNLWRAMLVLNLRFGFRIVGTYTQGVPGDEPKIIFEKALTA